MKNEGLNTNYNSQLTTDKNAEQNKVAEYWGKSLSVSEKKLIAWMEHPRIQRHINLRITGEPSLDWFTYVNQKYLHRWHHSTCVIRTHQGNRCRAQAQGMSLTRRFRRGGLSRIASKHRFLRSPGWCRSRCRSQQYGHCLSQKAVDTWRQKRDPQPWLSG